MSEEQNSSEDQSDREGKSEGPEAENERPGGENESVLEEEEKGERIAKEEKHIAKEDLSEKKEKHFVKQKRIPEGDEGDEKKKCSKRRKLNSEKETQDLIATGKALRKNTMADSWDRTFRLLEKIGADKIIQNVRNMCGSDCRTRGFDDRPSLYLVDSNLHDARSIFKKLPLYLEIFVQKDELKKGMIKILLKICQFMHENPWLVVVSNPTGAENAFTKSHTLNFEDKYLKKTSNDDCGTLDAFLSSSNSLEVKPLVKIHTHEFKIDCHINETKAKDMWSDRCHNITEFVNGGLPEELRSDFMPEISFKSLYGDGGGRTPDMVVIFGTSKIRIVVESKGMHDKLINGLHKNISSLSGLFDNILIQEFGYGLEANTIYGIINFGTIIILIKLLVDDIDQDPDKFPAHHILPHEFKIVDYRDPIQTVVNFFLDASQNAYHERLEEIKEKYRTTRGLRKKSD